MSTGTPSEPTDPQGEPVPTSETGYAVGEGDLRIDGDRFELDLATHEALAVRDAVEWDDETSSGLTESVDARRDDPVGFKGNTYRGDYPALDQIVDALNRFEKQAAGVGQDKAAYDARTAFNHASYAVREALEE